MSKTEVANHCWVSGLTPNTEYTYKVFVKDERVGRRASGGTGRRKTERSCRPATATTIASSPIRIPLRPPPSLSFAVIGDFGVGVRKDSPTHPAAESRRRDAEDLQDRRCPADHHDRRQHLRRRAAARPRRSAGPATKTTTGSSRISSRIATSSIGCRCIRRSAITTPTETEERDDRAQVEDNFYLRERILSEEAAGRASFCPGLFYRFRYGSDIEFVCIDTSKEDVLSQASGCSSIPSTGSSSSCRFPRTERRKLWRIPFAHHPPYCAGPQHHNTKSMQRLIPLFERSGVKVMFSGHEHNFQHSHVDGIDYFVTGAAGKLRRTPPDDFERGAYGDLGDGVPFPAGSHRGDADDRAGDRRHRDARSDADRHHAAGSAGNPHVGPIEVVRE